MRIVLILLAVVGCAAAPRPAPVAPAPHPHNIVCDRIDAMKALGTVDKAAVCTPELTDVGEHHLYTARVAVGEKATFACAINDAALTVICDDKLLVMVPQPESKAEYTGAEKKPDGEKKPAAKPDPKKK